MKHLLTILALLAMDIAAPAYSFTNRLPTENHHFGSLNQEGSMQTVVEHRQEKPRLTYQQFIAAQRPTVASLIERYLAEFHDIGESSKSQYAVISRSALGARVAADLKLNDYRTFALARRRNEVPTLLYRNGAGNRLKEISPSTVGKDLSSLAVMFTHAKDYWEVDVNLDLVKEAIRKLKNEGLIAKSKKRTRRPTSQELSMLLGHFAKQNLHKRTKTDMVIVTEFSCEAGRRISETCRIERQHVTLGKVLTAPDGRQFEAGTYWIYDLKNPNGKGVHHEFVLIGRALEIVRERMAVIADDPDAHLFPFNAKTCSSRYTLAKKALGIVDLRLHDNRRFCFSRLLAAGWTVTQVQHGWSGHLGDAKTLQDTYTDISADEILAQVAVRDAGALRLAA